MPICGLPDAPERATKWFNGLEAAIYSLENFPQRCPLAEESKAFAVEIRQLVYGKRVGAYRILFTIVGDLEDRSTKDSLATGGWVEYKSRCSPG